MISADWLLQWKCYIANKVSSSAKKQCPNIEKLLRYSENPKIGILPPGPISNYNLQIRKNNKEFELKPNLILNNDYRGVNKQVWDIFYKMYGGGPVFIRSTVDIYGPEPFDIEFENHMKAAAQNRNNKNQIIIKQGGGPKKSNNNIFAKRENNNNNSNSPRGSAQKQ